MSNHQLTHKQEKFILAVVEGMTQADAYRHAYNAGNMTDKTIIEKASKLMAQDNIRARYDEMMDKVKARLEEDCIVTVEEVVKELKKIGFADIKDFLSFGMEEVVVGYDEDGNEIKASRQQINIKNSDEVDGTLIGEVSISSKGVFSFKMHDKLSALEKIGKHLKMFTDKVEANNTNYNYNYEAELSELIK